MTIKTKKLNRKKFSFFIELKKEYIAKEIKHVRKYKILEVY